MKNSIKEFIQKNRKQKGASAVEYALLVVFIAAAIVATVTILGTITQASFCSYLTALGVACPL